MGLFFALIFILVWGGCTVSGGVFGFMLGWIPAYVITEIMAELFLR